jgi:phosphatidylserine/phosphatidylglycerophosphate/cardiolipin synthase-like enzyme
MSRISAASAYANNEVALIGWRLDADIPDCLGFEITRIYVDASGDQAAGSERVLAAWVPFEGQKNPDWTPQTTSVWPVQKLFWRDLTVRQKRDDVALRPSDVKLKYRIRAVVKHSENLEPVAPPDTTNTYQGAAIPLSYVDEGIVTNEVLITTKHGSFTLAFNNGILSTQWLKHAFEKKLGKKLTKDTLIAEVAKPNSEFRAYLTGDLEGTVTELLNETKQSGDSSAYLALYELGDAALCDRIIDCAPQANLILANSGQESPTKGAPKVWDFTNSTYRTKLHAARPAMKIIADRLFNNSQHIGHNKFVVHADEHGVARKVLCGSTNWTSNGLCAQTNNALLVESDELASQYLDYWKLIEEDNKNFTQPAEPSDPTKNVQGPAMRTADANRLADVRIDNNCTVTLWRSPNTKNVSKGTGTPPDLAELYSLMRKAQKAIFFAVFMPGESGKTSIIEEAIDIARKDTQLLVYGSISSPQAMPNYVPKPRHGGGDNGTDNDADNAAAGTSKPPATFDEGNIHVVRASALGEGDVIGDFEAELLSAGFAIIHDKILVIDPLSPDCIVAMGSHNLGFRASYTNDDNLLIIRGQRALAEAYMVHTMDLYEHYRFRAVEQQLHDEGKRSWEGFLSLNGDWQNRYLSGDYKTLVDYLATGADNNQ